MEDRVTCVWTVSDIHRSIDTGHSTECHAGRLQTLPCAVIQRHVIINITATTTTTTTTTTTVNAIYLKINMCNKNNNKNYYEFILLYYYYYC